MFVKMLALLIVFAGILAGVAYLQPGDYEVTRTAVINAPRPLVFEQVNNLRKWETWWPWAKLDDPSRKVTFSGPEAGTEAKINWLGNMILGEGSMVITESRPPERVVFNLEFVRPLKGTGTAEFMLTPQDNGARTEVTWKARGERDWFAKAMGLIFNGEKIMADYFDRGLASMKSLLETQAQAVPSPAAGPPMPQPVPAPSPAAAAPEAQPAPVTAPPAAVSEAVPPPTVTPSPPTSAAAEGAKVSVDVKQASPPAKN